jgi:hypothetical protein
MRLSALAALVGGEIIPQEGHDFSDKTAGKWSAFVDGKDGFLYGIPFLGANRVVKFDPVEQTMELIGPLFKETNMCWMCGVLANNGCIYCPPYFEESGILKINTVDGTVETFSATSQLPSARDGSWESGAVGPDNCIYYMPSSSDFNCILRLDTNTDNLSFIRLPNLERATSYRGTVLGNDNCLYGLPYWGSLRILKFNPMQPAQNISYYDECEHPYSFASNGVLGRDGNIYSLNGYAQVIKVNTSTCTLTLIGDPTSSDYFEDDWSNPIIGVDQCIYWPPYVYNEVLKFDPGIEQLLSIRVPEDRTNDTNTLNWYSGVLANDGVIYCIPWYASQVLTIDPLREISNTMNRNMRSHPKKLGYIFVQQGPVDQYDVESVFDSVVRKFGYYTAFRLLDTCLPSNEELTGSGTLLEFPLFVLAAASDNDGTGDVPLCVIYHLVKSNVNALFNTSAATLVGCKDLDLGEASNKKRKALD